MATSDSNGKILCTCPKCLGNSYVKDGVTHQGLVPATQHNSLCVYAVGNPCMIFSLTKLVHYNLQFTLCILLPGFTSIADSIPRDIQTITHRLNLKPVLESHVCCPKCYSLYTLEFSPLTCQYKETSKSRPIPHLSSSLRAFLTGSSGCYAFRT
ncbi:hypothetical protein VP01_1793g6, partial [Puccinia sorghi]